MISSTTENTMTPACIGHVRLTKAADE